MAVKCFHLGAALRLGKQRGWMQRQLVRSGANYSFQQSEFMEAFRE